MYNKIFFFGQQILEHDLKRVNFLQFQINHLQKERYQLIVNEHTQNLDFQCR